jgi:hypothetical protein
MVTNIILPALSRRDFPEACKLSFNQMGLLAITCFNSNFKNFLKLFFDQIEKNNPEFSEFEMMSLLVIFDSILQNNINTSEGNFFTGTIEEKIDFIIKKYLYHSEPSPRLVTFTGLCKLLIANRIGKPEFVLARLITVLYKSFDFTERRDEDFHIKIFEIMQNFLYTYCYTNKSHIKTVIKAVLIILTSHMMAEGNYFDRTLASTFVETRVEFLNQLLMVVHDFASETSSMKKIVFKIFKYLFFFYNYASGDIEKAIRKDEEYKKNKKYEFPFKVKDKVKQNIKRFFEKTKFDKYLVSEMTDETSFLKFFPFLLVLDEDKVLKIFSEPLYNFFDSVKSKNFIYDFSGQVMDLSSEEKQEELKQYVSNKENQYYQLIEEYHSFINSLKSARFNIIVEESSKIYEDADSIMTENKSRTSGVSRKSEGKKGKPVGMIKDEIEEEEKAEQEKQGKRFYYE